MYCSLYPDVLQLIPDRTAAYIIKVRIKLPQSSWAGVWTELGKNLLNSKFWKIQKIMHTVYASQLQQNTLRSVYPVLATVVPQLHTFFVCLKNSKIFKKSKVLKNSKIVKNSKNLEIFKKSEKINFFWKIWKNWYIQWYNFSHV